MAQAMEQTMGCLNSDKLEMKLILVWARRMAPDSALVLAEPLEVAWDWVLVMELEMVWDLELAMELEVA